MRASQALVKHQHRHASHRLLLFSGVQQSQGSMLAGQQSLQGVNMHTVSKLYRLVSSETTCTDSCDFRRIHVAGQSSTTQ